VHCKFTGKCAKCQCRILKFAALIRTLLWTCGAVILDCVHPREVTLSSRVNPSSTSGEVISVAGPRAWNSLRHSHLTSEHSYQVIHLVDTERPIFSSSPMTFSDLFCVAVLTVYVLVHIFNNNLYINRGTYVPASVCRGKACEPRPAARGCRGPRGEAAALRARARGETARGKPRII